MNASLTMLGVYEAFPALQSPLKARCDFVADGHG